MESDLDRMRAEMRALVGLPREDTLPRWFRAGNFANEAIYKRFRGGQRPSAMFHYTTASALLPIVQNNEIWLSDATFLNDRTEVDHGHNCVLARLDHAIADAADNAVSSMLSQTRLALQEKPKPPVYVACFSWEGDDLSQWRGYGRGGAPVCIEFEYSPLMFGSTDGRFADVRYLSDEQEWLFDQLIDAYAVAFAEDLRNPRPTQRDRPLTLGEEAAICSGKLYHDLWSYVVACKTHAFHSEREVRFVYIAHDFSRPDDDHWAPTHPSPMFRESGGRVIPYLSSAKLDFQEFQGDRETPRLPIASVRIGPIEDQELLRRGVRKLLDENGFGKAEALLSEIPFRG